MPNHVGAQGTFKVQGLGLSVTRVTAASSGTYTSTVMYRAARPSAYTGAQAPRHASDSRVQRYVHEYGDVQSSSPKRLHWRAQQRDV